MKTMTLDDVKNLPPLTAEEVEEVLNFQNTDFEDCPKQSKEDLAMFKPWYEVHKDLYKPKKADVHLKIDADVLEWFKAQGKGYQTKINAVLRNFVFH